MDGVLELLELQIEGLRSFSDNQTIDFEHRDKLVQIDGLNKDSGGSSGAGKSSIVIGIDYLFGISKLASTVLAPWDGLKTPTVYGKFRKNNILIEITRSAKKGLTVKIGDETTSGNSKLAEEKIDEIMGLPRDIFKRLIHKKQDDGSFFVKMTPKEKYEFLIKVLSLETKNLELTFVEDEVKDLTKKLELIEITVDSDENWLRDFTELRASKIAPVKPEVTVDIESVDKLITETKENIIKLKAHQGAKVLEIEKPVKTEPENDNTKIQELITEKNVIKEDISAARRTHQEKFDKIGDSINQAKMELKEVQNTKDKAKSIALEMNKKKAEREELEHKALCGTCKQSWTGEGAQAKLDSLSAEIGQHLSDILGFKTIIDGEADIQEKIVKLTDISESIRKIDPAVELEAKLEPITDLINQETSKLMNIKQAAENEFMKVETAYLKAVQAIKDESKVQIDDQTSKLNQLEQSRMLQNSQTLNYESQLKAFEHDASALDEKIDAKATSLAKLKIERELLMQNIKVASESARCLKSFILNTFQDTLTSIGETASDILSNVPNVSSATVFFEGFKETKSGSIKNEINAILSKNGYPDVPVKAMCGGEGNAIGQAIDLAVIDVIESKAGKGTDFYVMDEPFNGLDSVCREDMLEIIKSIDTNKKIIVIDHCNELKESVSDIIMVVKENDKSTIVE